MDSDLSAVLRKRLHDGLCQQLTSALMYADVLRRSLEERNAPEAADCKKLVEILQKSADELIGVMQIVTKKEP